MEKNQRTQSDSGNSTFKSERIETWQDQILLEEPPENITTQSNQRHLPQGNQGKSLNSKAILDRLYQNFRDPEVFFSIVKKATEFSNLSINNVILLSEQQPDATFIQTEKAWKSQGVEIKSDAIKIQMTKRQGKKANGKANFVVERYCDIKSVEPKKEVREPKYSASSYKEAFKEKVDFKLSFSDTIKGDFQFDAKSGTVLINRKLNDSYEKTLSTIAGAMYQREFQGVKNQKWLKFSATLVSYMFAVKCGMNTQGLMKIDPELLRAQDSITLKKKLEELQDYVSKIQSPFAEYLAQNKYPPIPFDQVERNINQGEIELIVEEVMFSIDEVNASIEENYVPQEPSSESLNEPFFTELEEFGRENPSFIVMEDSSQEEKNSLPQVTVPIDNQMEGEIKPQKEDRHLDDSGLFSIESVIADIEKTMRVDDERAPSKSSEKSTAALEKNTQKDIL